MKKILSLSMVALMLLSMVPTAFAVDHDVSNGTTIKLVGSQEAVGEGYSITVPAELQPGQSGTVSANGNWSSKQTLKVTTPSSVTLSYEDQVLDVGIDFTGIFKVGSDITESSATATVSVADASVLFGTWTGHLTYNVEMVDAPVQLVSFSINYDGDITTYQAEKGMTWEQWIESEYNTGGYFLVEDGSGYSLVTNDTRHALDGGGAWGPERGIDTIVDGKTYSFMMGGTI